MSNADQPGPEPQPETGISRRRLIGWAGASALAGAALTAGVSESRDTDATNEHPSRRKPVAFYGEHQAGIVTPAQDRLHFAAFDLLPGTTRQDLIDLLRTWSAAAAAMTGGEPIGGEAGSEVADAPPLDTGEARGLAAAQLTITIGFGGSLFEQDGKDRFGLRDRRPAALEPLPVFAGDALNPDQSDGDLAIQACADDPQVAVHAVRNLTRLAHGIANVRYSQLGFGRTSSTSTAQDTPRNLFGFKDGTANLKSEDPAALKQFLWVHGDDDQGRGPQWMTGGSYLVTRRIRMIIETWDRGPLLEQETIIGRHKTSGAPLGSEAEFDAVDLVGKGADGELLIPAKSHVRLAHPETNGGVQILRRGYSFVDGSDDLGRLNAGLFFIAYQRDPRKQFTVIQKQLAGKHSDLLNEYLSHVGSAVFACPPGVRRRGDWWGQALFS